MIKANLNRGKGEIQIEGDVNEIIADISFLINNIAKAIKQDDKDTYRFFKHAITNHLPHMAFEMLPTDMSKDEEKQFVDLRKEKKEKKKTDDIEEQIERLGELTDILESLNKLLGDDEEDEDEE